ncbi:hypothetical protein FGG08_000009 [Glutinoglossum americanum]|uniref:NACHT domain-containing protein n=1 Tax=Glutinoglossum americanum TaxID=1670608 RepID=A0A9P8IIK2_9PEZI|nr:hypothetical protein FGG08_000009 [Glutinoglossum americanum]
MSTLRADTSRLKPEIRLAQAVSQFEADLSSDQKVAFRAYRSQSRDSPPGPSDVMRLTAEIDRRASGVGGRRCFGPRFTNFLQAVQQFAALGDVIVGGSQNIIACGVWSLVRMSLLSIVNFSSYLDKLSTLLMTVGCSAPRYQVMASLYCQSKNIQSYLSEYFIVVVHLCHLVLRFTKRSAIGQFASTLSDSDIKSYQSELDRWANTIKEEANLLMARKIDEEAQENFSFKALSSKRFESVSLQRKMKMNLRVLGLCSTYDYETTWKQTRKVGNTTLFNGNVEYQNWKSRADSCTLIYTGKLGSGKSVLLANIVDDMNLHVQSKSHMVAYFFCRQDIPESLRARTIIGSLARQLLHPIPDLAVAAEIFDKTTSAPDFEGISTLLQHALPPDCKAYFILDGLDGCDYAERKILIRQLRKLQETFTLALCVSIRNALILRSERFIATGIASIPEENPDIEAFIETELASCIESGEIVIKDPGLILKIQDTLLKGSQGMFLWVALQIKSLGFMETDGAIFRALADLPKDLSETFTRILLRSEALGKPYQRRILELVTVAYRPLTIEELREALSVVPGDTIWEPKEHFNDVFSILTCCGSLLVVDEETLTVRLAHHSIRQFLLSGFKDSNNIPFKIDEARRRMADIIITYLGYGIFGTQLSNMVVPQIRAELAPSRIVRSTLESSSSVRNLTLKLLKSRKQTNYDIGPTLAETSKLFNSRSVDEFHFFSYAKLYWLQHILCTSDQEPAMYGLLLRLFQEGVVDADAAGEDGRTPLSWAAKSGHGAVVKQLLDSGKVDVSSKDKFGQTPLWRAAENGHEVVVKQLLGSSKVNPDSRDDHGQTPLSRAAENGHEAVVKQLLGSSKVDPDSRDDHGQTPLTRAAENGHEAVVKQLLDSSKADPDSRDDHGQTPLSRAAENGHEAVVKQLLSSSKVDPDSRDDHGQTPLSWAAGNGHETVAKLLLTTGKVDADSKDEDGRTPLWYAKRNRHEAMVKLLLDLGVSTNAQVGEDGNTPHAASYQQYAADSTEDCTPLRAPPTVESSSDILSIFTGSSKKPYSTVPSSSGIHIPASVPKPLSNKEILQPQVELEQRVTDETPPSNDGASTASPSSTNWTPGQRDTIVTEFSEAIRKRLPKNLLNATGGREFDGILLEKFSTMFKEFSNSVKQDASTKRIRAVSKSIRQFRQDISKRCVEKFWGDPDMLASPGLAERADALGRQQKTPAEKFYDWDFDLAASPLLDNGAHLPHGPQPQIEPITQRQISEDLPENTSGADAISSASSDSSETLPLEYKDIQGFLVNHAAFLDLIKNMERLLGRYCNDQMSIIGQRVFRSLQRSSSSHRVSFITDWDLVDFLSSEYELGLQQDLGRVLTITGEPINAQQVAVLTYLRQTWPSYPLNLLEAIQASVRRITHPEVSSGGYSSGGSTTPVQNSSIDNDISPLGNSINVDLGKREFVVTGSGDFVAVVAQQLSWLSAACRVSVGGLACGYLEFGCTSSVPPQFHIGIHVEPVKGNEACWNKIVDNSVVVRGFPIAQRRYCVGLQAPLETLAGLVGISLAMEHEGGYILKGRSHIFVPVERSEDEVQWHLIDRYPERIGFDEVDGLNKRLLFKDLDEVALQSTKAFLGWCSNATNRLGTSNVRYDYSGVGYSDTSKESTHELAFKGLGLGFSKIGTGTANFDYRNRQGVYNTEKSNSYKTTLEDASGLHVILQDTKDKRAWHTNAERLILHVILHRCYRGSFEIDKRPVYIEPADENAGVSVRDATWKNANTALYRDWKAGRDEETVWRFREMFEELLRTLEKLQYEEATVRTKPRIKLSWDPRSSILGWEYMDLVERKRQLHLKSTKVEATFGKWPYFARDIGAVVLFGSGFHDIFEPKEPDQLCRSFQTLPRGRGYLAMDISVLRALHMSEGSREDQARLTPTGFMWQRSTHVFERCNKTSQANQYQVNPCECKRIQELEKPSLINKSRRPGEIDASSGHDDGVVIFGATGLLANIFSKSQPQPHQDQHREISCSNPKQLRSEPICVSLEGDPHNEYVHSQAEIRVHNGRDVIRRNQDVSMSPEPPSLHALQPQLSDRHPRVPFGSGPRATWI